MVLVMLGVGIVSLRWGEKLPVGDGLGWDGVHFAAWAKDFHKSVFVDRVEDYYLQRVVPSAVVHYGARAVLWPFYSSEQTRNILHENKNVLLGFGIYNLFLLLLAVYLWGLVADNLGLTDRGKWFGFCALFINYAISKSNFYQPVLTDTSGFVLGMLVFYFFLTRQSYKLFAVMVISGFTWPTLPYMAALLLVFPRPDNQALEVKPRAAHTARRLSLLLSVVIAALTLLFFVYCLREDIPREWNRAEMVRIDFGLLYSSIAAVVIYLFFAFRAALVDGRLFDFRCLAKAVRWEWALVAMLTLLLLRFVVLYLQSTVPSSWTFKSFIFYTFLSALTEPFIFVVAHAVYYGPIVLLILIYWRPFCENAGQYGPGFKLFLILNLVLSICPQSRYQIPAIGAFVAIMVTALDRTMLPRFNLALWVLLSIFYSKVWYTFNTSPMNPDGTMKSFLTFPTQHFFMNSGPWMSKPMYLAQGSVVLATAIALYVAPRRNTSRSFLSTEPAATG